MVDLLTAPARRLLRTAAPEPDDALAALEAHARERDFPIVGADVGRLLSLLARVSGAERAFEFGSGFGYSAVWIARGLAPGGSVVLVEEDADELAMAEEVLRRAGLADRAAFEVGDAIEVVDRYDGPFDFVVFDHEDHRYVEALDAVEAKIAPGGLLVADNAMRAGELIDLDTLCELLEANRAGSDESGGGGGVREVGAASPATRGIAAYLDRVLADPAFETVIVPLGDGVAVSRKREEPGPF